MAVEREALRDWHRLFGLLLTELLTQEQFRLYAVSARFPHNLSGQVPWQKRQSGVYDCVWGTDTVRVIVAGQLPREAHNAPLHLFSASAELVGFGRSAYRQRSERTSRTLRQLFRNYHGEDLVMPYTWADFDRDYIKAHFPELTPEEQKEVLESLPPEALQSLPLEKRLAGLSAEQIRHYLQKLTAPRQSKSRKTRRKR